MWGAYVHWLDIPTVHGHKFTDTVAPEYAAIYNYPVLRVKTHPVAPDFHSRLKLTRGGPDG